MLPRLVRLLQEAEAAGFARAPCVAVIADIMMQPTFNTAPLPAEPDNPAPEAAVPPNSKDYDAPSLGPTDWIKPTGQA
jgi:hypothetical protein